MVGLLALKSDELEKVKQFEHWGEPDFLMSFFLASAMGSILNYSIFLCTLYNSALTTTVVGCLKNVLTTYIGVRSSLVVPIPYIQGLTYFIQHHTITSQQMVFLPDYGKQRVCLINSDRSNGLTTISPLPNTTTHQQVFSYNNFIGLNISIFGSLLYSWNELKVCPSADQPIIYRPRLILFKKNNKQIRRS